MKCYTLESIIIVKNNTQNLNRTYDSMFFLSPCHGSRFSVLDYRVVKFRISNLHTIGKKIALSKFKDLLINTLRGRKVDCLWRLCNFFIKYFNVTYFAIHIYMIVSKMSDNSLLVRKNRHTRLRCIYNIPANCLLTPGADKTVKYLFWMSLQLTSTWKKLRWYQLVLLQRRLFVRSGNTRSRVQSQKCKVNVFWVDVTRIGRQRLVNFREFYRMISGSLFMGFSAELTRLITLLFLFVWRGFLWQTPNVLGTLTPTTASPKTNQLQTSSMSLLI